MGSFASHFCLFLLAAVLLIKDDLIIEHLTIELGLLHPQLPLVAIRQAVEHFILLL